MLVHRGSSGRGGGRAFAGVVVFDLHELAEWAGAWTRLPVAVSDATCATCGKVGVRLVAEGEPVEGEAVCCANCRLQANNP